MGRATQLVGIGRGRRLFLYRHAVPETSVRIFHNPSCNSSKNALAIAAELGIQPIVVEYLKKAQRPDRETLEWLVAHLDDPVADLVRKDALFEKLALDPGAYVEPGPVIELLLAYPALMQRPVVVKGERALIGRPKERVRELLTG